MNKLTGPLLDAAQTTAEARPIARSLERRLRTYVIMMLMDAVVLHLAFALAEMLYEGSWSLPRNIPAALTLLPLFFTIALYNETYGDKPWPIRHLRQNAA